jgi:hypothetical protein
VSNDLTQALDALKRAPTFRIPGVPDPRLTIPRAIAKALLREVRAQHNTILYSCLVIALDDAKARDSEDVYLWAESRERILHHLSTPKPQEG